MIELFFLYLQSQSDNIELTQLHLWKLSVQTKQKNNIILHEKKVLSLKTDQLVHIYTSFCKLCKAKVLHETMCFMVR